MRIDHLVWYCPDLSKGRSYFEAFMDGPPAYGGEHQGEGTANYLLGLGPSTYLEILGPDPSQSEDRLAPEVRSLRGTGLYHWAIGGIDLTTLTERARKAGLTCSDPVPGGRQRPDGSSLAWTCLGINDHDFGALVPFFIDWSGCEHPALSAPHGGRLAEFEIVSPRHAELREIFDALDLDIRIRAGSEPHFSATLESANGRKVLSSFAPLPRGYVI